MCICVCMICLCIVCVGVGLYMYKLTYILIPKVVCLDGVRGHMRRGGGGPSFRKVRLRSLDRHREALREN